MSNRHRPGEPARVDRECARCGSPVYFVRSDHRDGVVVDHYRCGTHAPAGACRGGGHRALFQDGSVLEVGPIFAGAGAGSGGGADD